MQPYTHLARLETLEEQDFKLFYFSFKEVVEKKIPHFSELFFLGSSDRLADYFQESAIVNAIASYFQDEPKRQLFNNLQDTILLALPAGNDVVVVALTGVDVYFARRVSNHWLDELRAELVKEFLLIKQAGCDLETELLNSLSFHKFVREFCHKAAPSVILIELYPRSRSAKEARMHTARAARSLKSCMGTDLPLFYLGHHVFGLLLNDIERSRFKALSRRVFVGLRRDGFQKVHIGIRHGEQHSPAEETISPHTVLDQTDFALQTARKRGPFALCDYDHLSCPEKHPLRKPSKAVLAKFRKRWRNLDKFSIAELQTVAPDSRLIDLLGTLDNAVHDATSLYIFYGDTDGKTALHRCEQLLNGLQIGDVVIGVASYPFLDYSKSATAFNCRKAVSHAAFFGPAGRAVFDSLSLNISGDIYYAEGDLTSAVKEYRSGIAGAPDDVNLLNSLGVAYADMGKFREARQCFEKVLALDGDNFMAYYNSGLEAEHTGRSEDALRFFEKAYSLSEDNEEVGDDLRYRLGQLYAVENKYQQAIAILADWYRSSPKQKSKERVLAAIGLSYFGLKEYEQAVTYLQQALQYNEFDAMSMGLLGLCYLLLKEGDDIALSLCEKSVELDPANIELKLHLARVQIACGLHEDARGSLRKCLHGRQTRVRAQLLSCINYKEQGMLKRARYWLAKLQTNDQIDEETACQVRNIDEEINEI